MMPEPNDPTRAGAPVPQGVDGQVRLSMTELETLAAKAARGAGLEWGLAEEAGVAVRWLQARGFDGADLLIRHLKHNTGGCWRDMAPVIEKRVWSSAGSHPLSPITAGTTLGDYATLPDGLEAGPIDLLKVDGPGLLLPFLSGLSHLLGKPCAMEWAGNRIVVFGNDVHSRTSTTTDILTDCADVRIFQPDAANTATLVTPRVRKIAIDTLRGLDALAMSTTVPASEQSRQGAGAGTSDND